MVAFKVPKGGTAVVPAHLAVSRSHGLRATQRTAQGSARYGLQRERQNKVWQLRVAELKNAIAEAKKWRDVHGHAAPASVRGLLRKTTYEVRDGFLDQKCARAKILASFLLTGLSPHAAALGFMVRDRVQDVADSQEMLVDGRPLGLLLVAHPRGALHQTRAAARLLEQRRRLCGQPRGAGVTSSTAGSRTSRTGSLRRARRSRASSALPAWPRTSGHPQRAACSLSSRMHSLGGRLLNR